jgi:hypothetical protein
LLFAHNTQKLSSVQALLYTLTFEKKDFLNFSASTKCLRIWAQMATCRFSFPSFSRFVDGFPDESDLRRFRELLRAHNLKVIFQVFTDGPVTPGSGGKSEQKPNVVLPPFPQISKHEADDVGWE